MNDFKVEDLALCPCCSEKFFKDCCKYIIAGTKLATSPLELMRSRYSAHVCKNMPHIMRTMRGKALKLFDEEKTSSEWFNECSWEKLEIIDAPIISKHDRDGIVEFKAYYKFQNKDHILHERSKFKKEDDHWYYVAGQYKSPNVVINANAKIGRNDNCPCGSGLKYKKCCA